MDRRGRAGLGLERLEGRSLFAVGGTAAPVNLVAMPVSASEIGLSWDLVASGGSSVVVERRTGATGGFATLAVLPAGESIFTDTSCWAGQDYTYRVRVSGPAGESDSSSESTAGFPPMNAGRSCSPTPRKFSGWAAR